MGTLFDKGKADAFSDSMVETMNRAATALMLSVGHRTGLFDAMAEMASSTSADIARAARLDERYVREWLGAMVTARVVDYDAATKTYSLPAEHVAAVSRKGGMSNVARLMQNVAMLGKVEDAIVDAFRNGGGVPYAAFGEFQHVMAESSNAVAERALINGVLPIVDGIVDRLRDGIDVADVGCGSGHAVNLLAEAFPSSRFVGYDISEAGITTARAEAEELGLTNARFDVQDAATLAVSGAFDFVTAFDAIHDQADPAAVLRAIAGALREGGVFLCVDIQASSELGDNVDHPMGPFLYTISTMHCMTVSLAEGGAGLGAMWGEQLAHRMLHDAGFASVQTKRIPGDYFNNYYVARLR